MLSFRHTKLRLAYGVGNNITCTPVNWCGAEVSVQESKNFEVEKLSPVTFEGNQCVEHDTLSENFSVFNNICESQFVFSVLSIIS